MNEEETMRCGGGFAGREGYLYRQIRCNRRSNRTAPCDCLFGFNGVDAVAVRERSSSTKKDGGSTIEDLLLTESKTSIKLEAKDSELNDVRINMHSVSNVLIHLRHKRLGTNENRGDRVQNRSLRRKNNNEAKSDKYRGQKKQRNKMN